MASILLIKNADLFSPAKMGPRDILCLEGKIRKIAPAHSIEEKHLACLGVPYEIVDAQGALLMPGLIDPHQHFLGGSGEKGFCTRSPEIGMAELIRGGITTMVGCIGVDAITRNMQGLLAQAKYFNEEGLTAYIWSGGYPVPPVTLTGSITSDMILVSEVVGAGELALSDYRSSEPTNLEIAKVVSQSYIGGILTNKCGATHFHMGDGKRGLEPLFEVLRDFDIHPNSLYPTHVSRNPRILAQAAQITQQKVTVDFDVCDEDLVPSLSKFVECSGDLGYLTISSDASFASPEVLFSEIRKVVMELKWPWEKILPLATTNTARMLKLPLKGEIREGADADMIIVDPQELNLKHVVAKGKVFMKDGEILYAQKCLQYSNRRIEIYGKKEKS